ncbi:MAG TPA: aldo/keto reductase [Acidobacteriota bacterium]|nr:aldo/keto reductase [Acidobacteriota bacterium]
MNHEKNSVSRRRFLHSAAAVGAGIAFAGNIPASQKTPATLPKVKFGKADITRLIIGSNPFYGYSHFNNVLDRTMREWYTQEHKMEVLHRCEQFGINTWQLHFNDQPVEDFKRYRDEGGKMNLILLADFALMKDLTLLPKVVKEMAPLGIGHHGNRTDERFRNGEMGKVREFLKAVRDTGVMVGLSAHNPEVFDMVESQGWDIDYYQTCLYRVSRTPEEARKVLGEAPVGEIYLERDPERMCKVIRQTKKPCLAFKVLGAGRSISSPQTVEAAFRFALTNIKPTDAIIVGMFPRYKDEVRENTELVRQILGPSD